jgi:hypothetical protein
MLAVGDLQNAERHLAGFGGGSFYSASPFPLIRTETFSECDCYGVRYFYC